MKVHLAGYNVDTTVLRELQKKGGKREDVTPEVLSAAYARISRDPRSIEAIRADARGEVEKTRRSNSTIIFRMGHHSVAEHAVFNLDVVGLSRYAMEELEKFRLCSYTEKSQRYITLDKDYVVPAEIEGKRAARTARAFRELIAEQNEMYADLYGKLKEHVFAKHPGLAADEKKHNLLEGWAKEDARYVTALATQSQVGLTVNARNLELMLRRFASHPLAEVQELGRLIYRQIAGVAPSIVLFHQANERDTKTYPGLRAAVGKLLGRIPKGEREDDAVHDGTVHLVEYTKDGDEIVLAALVHSVTDLPFEQCRTIAEHMPRKERENVFKAAWENLQFYDSMLREFEYVNLTYNIALSSACFGQLKRHRMATITSQPYDPRLGVTVPPSIREIGKEAPFRKIVKKSEGVYRALLKEAPIAAPYALTNAHRKRVLMRVNAREMYHISRLREDAHAQWDIRVVSREMTEQAKAAMPLVFRLAGGKDKYNEIYENVFGRLPKVTETALPGVRKIKK